MKRLKLHWGSFKIEEENNGEGIMGERIVKLARFVSISFGHWSSSH